MTTDERLAALEAKMDALTAPPSDYYTSRYSGEEIDAAIAAVPGKAETAQLCNRNLLDNWYFGNPVNQRGATVYSDLAYTIDRWREWSHKQRIELTGNGLNFAGGGNFAQKIAPELSSSLLGKTLTISKLTADGALKMSVFTLPDSAPSVHTNYGYVDDSTPYMRWFANADGLTFYNVINTTQIIVAVKLELGSQQTLAHQDADGNWVLNEVPEYGEQLRRCQRYFVRINNVYASGVVANSNTSFVDFAMPVPLRTNPVLTVRDKGQLSSAGTLVVPSEITLAAREENHIYLGVTTPATLTANQPACLHDACIDFSADL